MTLGLKRVKKKGHYVTSYIKHVLVEKGLKLKLK